MKTRSRLQLAALILAFVGLAGCSVSGATIANYITIAMSAGSKILSAVGVLTPQVGDYITQGETWLADVTAELATNDTNAVKVLKITQEFATIVQPDLTGAGTIVQLAVVAFSIALSAVLAAVQSSAANQPAALAAARSGAQHFVDSAVLLPTPAEARELASLHKKALAVVAQVAKRRAGKK
jgi:hypothetical protein